MGFCICSMFCWTFLYVPSSFAFILMGKRELVALLSLSSWCRVTVVWLFLTVPWVSLQFVIVVFPIILTYYYWLRVQFKNYIFVKKVYFDQLLDFPILLLLFLHSFQYHQVVKQFGS